jgi:DNA-directed RNA polymerase specialized sigma24 family protein
MSSAPERHRALREALRHYIEFREYASGWGRMGPEALTTDRHEIEYRGVRINFFDLQGCLASLSPRKKEAVFWNVIMDKKQKDVAEIMEITTGSVNQYVEQGMLQIAAALWPEGGDE